MPQTGSFASAPVASARAVGKWCLCSMGDDRYTFPSWEGQANSRNEHRRRGGLERRHRQDDPPLRGDRAVAPGRATSQRLSRLWRARSPRIEIHPPSPSARVFNSRDRRVARSMARSRPTKPRGQTHRRDAYRRSSSARRRDAGDGGHASRTRYPHATATTAPTARSSTILRWVEAPGLDAEGGLPRLRRRGSRRRQAAALAVWAPYTAVSKSMYPPTEAGSANGRICVAQKPPTPFLRSIQ